MKTKYISIIAAIIPLIFSSCFRDELYNTPHPDHGSITVAADWSHRGEGVPVPERWTIFIGDYTAEETGDTHEAGRLFEPGNYRLITCNSVHGITVEGTTATVSPASAVRGSTFISGNPGWLFTAVQDIAIEKDRRHLFTAAMRQQTGMLTLILEPDGNTAEIEDIAGHLSGVAGKFDFAADSYGDPSDVELKFEKITDGTDAGKWKATVRMLGIAGDRQRLSATVTFAGGKPEPVTIESDLSASLAGFNAAKTVPITLGASIVVKQDEAGFTATIEKWEEADGGNFDAN